MNDEQHLRDLLAAAVPEPPVSADRAARARAYAATRGRRRMAVGAAAAAVLVAMALPFALTNDNDNELRESENRDPTVEPGSVDCPAVRDWRTEPDPTLKGAPTLESGAVAVRLCNPYGAYWQAPADALITDADRMVELVNSLEPEARAPGDRYCPAVGSPFNWEMQFQYANGTTRLIRGSGAGCGYLEIGRAQYLGAERVANRFLTLLGRQRSASEPPASINLALPCPDYAADTGTEFSPLPIELPLALTDAVICWQRELNTELPPARAPLTSAQRDSLLAALNAESEQGNPVSSEECTESVELRIALIGSTPWGDRVHLRSDCGVFAIGDDERWTWRPGPAARQILDELIATHPQEIPLPDADAAADITVSTWVDLVNAGQRERADRLWITPPQLPAEFEKIAFKGEELRTVTPEPGSPESAYAQVKENLALYSLVPTGGGYVEYRQMRFLLVRNTSTEPWRILSMTDLGAVSTGR